MDKPDYGLGRSAIPPRGPYGTNEGDIWLMEDYFQKRIKDEKGPGWRMIIEMLPNKETGKVEPHFYTTELPELVKRADEGALKYAEQQAKLN